MSNLLSQRREVGEFKKRYKWMALVVVITFAVLATRMVQLQVLDHGEYAAIAEENITRRVTLPATRGVIRDTEGREIASNEPSYNVYIIPHLLRGAEDVQRVIDLMALSDEEAIDFRQRLQDIPERRQTHQIKMFTQISRDQMSALRTHARELRAVDVVAEPVRRYAYGTLGAHTLGYLNEVNAEDLAALSGQGYRRGDRIGRTGLERAWESYLRGTDGERRILVNATGERRDSRREELFFQEAVPGRDIQLTLDMELMRSIDRTFRGHPSGAAVVVDVRTGRVRAMYSKPSYDLNEMSGRLTQERFAELRENPFRPLIDKSVYESFFPGSTYKPITALAGLQNGIVNPAARVGCPGYWEIGNERKRCTAAHGEVDMREALVQSCNVYFWTIAQEVGLERLNQVGRDFGIGDRTGVGINSEATGFLPSREWYADRFGRFRLGYTLDAAIGQGNTRATLLQLALAYSAMANGGTLYVPQVVERISAPDADGATIEEFEPRVRRRVSIDREHLAYVVDGLYGVVNDPTGTAFGAHLSDGVPIAGKTGTAQVARRRPRRGEDERRVWYFNRAHAWFAGFAPAGDPEIAIVVLVEHGGGGGRYAAPIAIQIVEDYLAVEEPPTTASADLVQRGRQ
ncbi:MAG: penicillin-binding protein 2 [Myxococcota bacterium]